MTKALKKPKYEPVDASPVKSFFVTMLTRDINLSDAILDLLDNCVDGILRTKRGLSDVKPYQGFKADISFDKNAFAISDNCGGIPWSLHTYAFHMGRPDGRTDSGHNTVGAYGIGMKRAIFKIGKDCLISTKHDKDEYEVAIPEKWMLSNEWKIQVKEAKDKLTHNGTTIAIKKLHNGIAAQFSSVDFIQEITTKIATHYAFIIKKGFAVTINGNHVKGKTAELVFAKNGKPSIRPYMYRANVDGVKVFIAVGFTRSIPSQESVINEQEERKHSSMDAGWTVLCNDRAVLYCDKTELTGWGVASVPQYHTQFIAISGIVEFQSDDPSKLPTTTTKRGIDASSKLYLQIKDRMREGMLQFIRYTNKWKADVATSKKHIDGGDRLSLNELKDKAKTLSFSRAKSQIGGDLFMPSLPMPPQKLGTKKRISFSREIAEINVVSYYLFKDKNIDPSEVGEKCFDVILREARK